MPAYQPWFSAAPPELLALLCRGIWAQVFSQIELQLVKIPAEAHGLHMGSRVITDRLAVGKHDSSLILAMNLLRLKLL